MKISIGNLTSLYLKYWYLLSNWTLIEIGDLIRSILKVYIKTLLSNVDFAIGEPLMEMEIVDSEHRSGKGVPMDQSSLILPISNGISNRQTVCSLIRSCKSNASLQNHAYNCKLINLEYECILYVIVYIR